MLPVAVVQHEPSVPPGSVGDVLAESGVDHLVVEAWRDEASWPRAEALGGLVVLGGTMNVDELDAYPLLRTSGALMADAIEAGIPTLGVCLGSQMMSRVLGGEVVRADPRNAFFSPLEVDGADPLVAPFADGRPVLQFHEDTFTLPPGAVELARSAGSGLLQAFRYGECAYAVQFHFEVDRPILEAWCRNIGEEILVADWGVSTEELLTQADRHLDAQRAAGRALLRGFLDAARVTA